MIKTARHQFFVRRLRYHRRDIWHGSKIFQASPTTPIPPRTQESGPAVGVESVGSPEYIYSFNEFFPRPQRPPTE